MTVEALGVARAFGRHRVVDGLHLSLAAGQVHALLGPNAAGKTTVLRMVAGLTAPSAGDLTVLGGAADEAAVRSQIGWIPSNDRAFYLRLGGRENLVFFARLYGMSLPSARWRADELLPLVGLQEAARQPVRTFSHGMVKRLAVARGLLNRPRLLVVDEATHDLDPLGAEQIRGLVTEAAREGATVLWATQRIDEIRGFADTVTVLDRGRTSFQGPVLELIGRALSRVFIIRLAGDTPPHPASMGRAVAEWGLLAPHERLEGLWRLSLKPDAALTDVFASLAAVGVRVHSCSEERSELEDAFLTITEPRP